MTGNFKNLPHKGIQTLSPYIPGKSIEELAREQGISDIIKLASNENPLGCSPLVTEALARISGLQLATYPSPAIHPLRRKLSDKSGIDESMLCLSNGSDLLFCMLMIIFGLHNNKHILTHEMAFISYQIQAQGLGIDIRFSPLKDNYQVDIPAMVAACNIETSLLFIANPNNPTGSLISHDDLYYLMSNVPASTIVVLDEAYYEFTPQTDNYSIQLLSNFPNLVITRTFSKAYGLAGLRLGYAIAHPEIIELILRQQLPFSVNQVAMTAGLAALDDEHFLAKTLANNLSGMEQMRSGLEKLGYTVLPSACNFVTFDCGMNATHVYEALLKQGIIVRPLAAYGLTNYLRVSIGKMEQNARFLDKLAICI